MSICPQKQLPSIQKFDLSLDAANW